MRATLCLLIVAFCLVEAAQGACTKDHPKVGLSAELSTLDHDVEGTVVIVDDCTFRVDGFKYDGTGPDVFWYAADERKNLEAGYILDSIPRSDGVWDGTREVTVSLPDGTTWDDVNVISVWCRQFGINFGDLEFPEPTETPTEDTPKEKVTVVSETTKKEKNKKVAVDKELTEATERGGSLSGGSLGSFSGGSVTATVSSDTARSVSSGSTSSFAGGSSVVSTRGTATARAGDTGTGELKQVDDEFELDQEEIGNENGSASTGSSLLSLLGTLAIGVFFAAC